MRPSYLPVLLLFACASAPKVEYSALDLAQPDQWTAGASEGTVADQWWRDMGAVRLDSLVALALEHNYDLKIAGARLAQAQAQARAAGAPLWPQLSAGANGSKRKQNFVGLPIPGRDPDQVLTSESTSFGVDLTASWEADLCGVAYARVPKLRSPTPMPRLLISARRVSRWQRRRRGPISPRSKRVAKSS